MREPLRNDPDFARGAALYAAGEYWDAHEAWEKLWRDTDDDETRLFVQALIQVAAALHKIYVKRDAASAARLFDRALSKLEQLPDVVCDIPVAALRGQVEVCRDVLEHDQDGGGLNASRVPRVV